MKLIIARKRRGWYWSLKARNGRIVALGGEPFSSRVHAQRSFAAMWRALEKLDGSIRLDVRK